MTRLEKLFQGAITHFEQEETAITFVGGLYVAKFMNSKISRAGLLIATNKRIIFYVKKIFGYDMEVFPYSSVSSIELSKDFFGQNITFFASGNKVSMKHIISGDVQKFISEVKERIGNKLANLTSPSLDVADQIRKLADLKEEGILTLEEFDLKKKQLLGI